MEQYNLLFTQHVANPRRASEVAMRAIRSVYRRVNNHAILIFLSIRLLPEHALELIPLMPIPVQEFMATRLDNDIITREYNNLSPHILYAAIISQKEPLHYNIILSLMDMINGYRMEKVYYAALDRYLLKHGMSEIEFLRRFDPRGSRLEKILSMYPDEDVIFNRDIEYTNMDSIGGIPINTIHDDQLWVDNHMYAFPSSDLISMSRSSRYGNPYTATGDYRMERNRFLTVMARRRIPMVRSGAVEYYEPPLEYEHIKNWGGNIGVAVDYGHDMRWYITLTGVTVRRAAVLLGGNYYFALEKDGYKFIPMDNVGVIADVGDFLHHDVHAPPITMRYMRDAHDVALTNVDETL